MVYSIAGALMASIVGGTSKQRYLSIDPRFSAAFAMETRGAERVPVLTMVRMKGTDPDGKRSYFEHGGDMPPTIANRERDA